MIALALLACSPREAPLEPPPPIGPIPDGPDPDTSAPEPAPVDPASLPGLRFAVLGDGGDGSAAQLEVAEALRQVCAVERCDFALYLGDAIYPSGVSSVEDPQFQDKFELPYAALDFPFYVVTGNHDYGSPYDPLTARHQVEYTEYSSKWRMPALYYEVDLGDVALFGLDTTALVWGDGADQAWFFDLALASSDARWKLAFGHHPYISNGAHGNAGLYDGRPADAHPRSNGRHLKDFFEATLCEGRIDVYFAGHDHDRQWLKPACGVEHVVSGAAARLRPVFGDNPTFYESSELGFLHVVIDGPTLTGTFYGTDAQPDFQRVLVKD